MDTLQDRIDFACQKNLRKETENVAEIICQANIWIDVASGRAVIMRKDGKRGIAMSVPETAKILELKA